jgi:hypothetical protein
MRDIPSHLEHVCLPMVSWLQRPQMSTFGSPDKMMVAAQKLAWRTLGSVVFAGPVRNEAKGGTSHTHREERETMQHIVNVRHKSPHRSFSPLTRPFTLALPSLSSHHQWLICCRQIEEHSYDRRQQHLE